MGGSRKKKRTKKKKYQKGGQSDDSELIGSGPKRNAPDSSQTSTQTSRQRINSPDQQYSFYNTITTGVSQLAQSASNFFWGTNIDADSDNDNTSTEPRQRTLTPTIQATGQKRKASASDEEQSDKEQSDKEQKRQATGPATIQATTTGQNQRQGQRTLKPTDDNTYTLLEVRAVAQLFNPDKYPDEWFY